MLPLLTAVVMMGFAANSLLCRAALGHGSIDAVAFTEVRLLSGAIALTLLCGLLPTPERKRTRPKPQLFLGTLALVTYAGFFSTAYSRIDAGVGALLLFGMVQVTMIANSVLRGSRPRPLEWIGLLSAVGGLAYLTLPGKNAPEPIGAGLMAVAGVAWGVYSILGKKAEQPTRETRDQFLRGTALFAAIAIPYAGIRGLTISQKGLALAIVSGAVTSALIYALWYSVLPRLRPLRASIVQLSVPLIAITASHWALGEPFSARTLIASGCIIGGIGLALAGGK